MAKEALFGIVIIVLIVGAVYFYFQEQPLNNNLDNILNTSNNIQSTSGDLKREIPLEVNSRQEFEIKYIIEPSPSFKIAAIEDTVSGGCKFSGNKDVYRTIVFDSGEIIVKVTAPASGSCTFLGEYGYADNGGGEELKNFPSQTVKIK